MKIHSFTKDEEGNTDFHVDLNAEEAAKLIHYAIYITFLGGLQDHTKQDDGSYEVNLKDLPDEAFIKA